MPRSLYVGPDQVVLAKPHGCFRALATVVEEGFLPNGFKVKVGHSHVALCATSKYSGRKLILINIHLPHGSRPVGDLQAAVDSLIFQCSHSADNGDAVFMFGDFNQCLIRGGGDRRLILDSLLQRLGFPG